MKETTKRILSLVLAFVMVLGLLPGLSVNVSAAEGVIDAAIFCSDVHDNPSTVTSVFNGIKSADSTFAPSTASFVGDTQCASSSVTSAAQSVFPGVGCYYAFGNHDDEGNYGISDVTGLIYGDSTTNYYIYAISENSMASSNPDTSGFTSTVAGLDKTKPLFIISHMPLHQRRNDNNGAAAWYDAISAAAESMDIFFFWAHNHTSEGDADIAAYYVAKNGSETISIQGGSTVTPNFTYANAGYIAPPNTPARNNVATAVRIYDDSVNLTVYNADGVLTGTYAVNETVTRQFATGSDSGDSDGSTDETTATDPTEDTTTTEEKEVYVLVDSLTNNGEYLIVNTSTAGSGYAMNHSSGTEGAVEVTVQESGDYIYIDLDDSTAVWTATTKSSGFELMNGSYYLEAYGSTSAIEISTTQAYSARYWNYTDSALGYYGGTSTHYIYYSDGFVSAKNSGSEPVYIYEKQTIEVSSDGGDSGEDDTTTGGSTETVVGEGTYTTADDGSYQKVTFETTVTGTETKTVYVLSSGNPSGNVLIANSAAAGSVNLVANDGGDLSNTSATVVYGDCDGDGDSEYYIELTDTEATNSLWAVSGSYTFENQDEYLRCNNGNLSVSSQSTTWSYSSNRLSYKSSGMNSKTYYLRYNSSWTVTSSSSSASSIYFYVPTEVEVETTETITVTYSVSASDIEHFYSADTTDTETVTISKSVTDGTPEGTYAYEVVGGDNIITSISEDGVITFNGTEGTAQVKVSYTWTEGENTYTIWQVIDVTATEPTYILDITSGGKVVTGTTIAQKGVTDGKTLQLGTQIQFVDEDGAETVELPEGATIQWNIPEEYHSIATVDQNTGLVTFKGVDGAFYVTATLTVGDKDYTVGVNISATTSQYSTPTDGTDDFPEYPNEGAIRYDKTGTAVGNFSETGIAQIELSMTGVPYTTGSEIDVVVMLDMSTSMDDDRIAATVAATKVFVESIVKNTDGTYNENRIYVGYFNGDSVYTITDSGNIGGELATVDNDTEYNALIAAIEDEYNGSKTASGTNYDVSLEKCYNVLTAAKTDGTGNDRAQFCVFMSDGGPTDYATSASNVVSESTVVGWFDVSASDSANWTNSVVEEYWSGLMKDNDVTIYSVGLILNEQPTSGPQDYRSYSAEQNYYVTSTILTGIASGEDYFINCESADDTDEMEGIFSNIAAQILQAATDITVEDKITDEYTMIFDIPEGSKDITGVTNDFYIEFGKYALDENHERTTFTSVTKLYLENNSGVLSAKDSTDPVFEQKTIGDKGTLYYWSTNASDGDTGISITVDGTTYYFVSYGLEEAGYNMTSGAYAHGTVDSTTNMSEDLVIATSYFVYNADTRMLYWTVDKLDTYEYALRYFLYLNNSATEVATDKETDPGSYPTNDHAYITYTNFQGNDCRQVFPIPQLTWNGAQVSYVFYLVNAAGQPINKSGQVVDFANATFITDVYTKAVVWNKGEDGQVVGDSHLSQEWLAQELLPEEYSVYDEAAEYELMVYADATGEAIFNYFTIAGGSAKSISDSLNERLTLDTTSDTVSVETTKVYNTKAGVKYDEYGTYTSKATDSIDNETILSDFDFANTTVAFAVVWQPRLVPDVVVVDYGLDVLINVVQNDILQNNVTGIGTGTAAYEKENVGMNTGVSTTSKLGTADLTIDGNTISLVNDTSVRFHQGDMEFDEKVVFYYETPVEFWEGSDPTEGYMYSSVTVIPATTIYYEDEFVDLSIWDMNDVELNEEWAVVGTTVNDTQDQDRPGDSKISDAIDADNIYGYDSAYTDCAMYSMGSARVVTVDDTRYAEAQFTFYGTGFDIISLTSNTSGTISMDVYGAVDFEDKGYDAAVVKSGMVDTYYGYTQDEDGNWIVDTDVEGKLYQIPVMKISDLEYGRYTVIITTAYYSKFDHQNHGSLDFYLDAVRIYDPSGNEDSSINDYYVEDHEGWPVYQELRNNVIESADDAGQIAGAVYIDGAADNVYAVADYNAYGPNNELYLAPGQMIAFSMNLDTLTMLDALHIAMKSANGGTVSCQIFDAASIQDQGDVEALKAQTIATATDLYYDISDLKDDTIVIYNSSTNGAILSITNLKATFTEDPGDVTINFSVIEEDALTALLTALNTEETEEEEITDPTDPSEPSEGTEDEDTGSGSSSTIGRIIDWLRKLLGWG